MADFTVLLRPHEERDGSKNLGGLIVLVGDGEIEQEVARVAYARRHSKNKDVAFEDQLAAEIDKAQAACDEVNTALDEFERAQRQAIDDASARVRAILGPAPRGKPA